MKKTSFISLAIIGLCITCSCLFASETHEGAGEETYVKELTYDDFIKYVWDIENSPNAYQYKGSVPCVIDFYATWCGPCKRVAPIMEKLAEQYDGKIIVYKVDTDKEKKLAALFGIQSIPTVFFMPMEGQPAMQVGALNEEGYVTAIKNYLLK